MLKWLGLISLKQMNLAKNCLCKYKKLTLTILCSKLNAIFVIYIFPNESKIGKHYTSIASSIL